MASVRHQHQKKRFLRSVKERCKRIILGRRISCSKMDDILSQHKETLERALIENLESPFANLYENTWAELRRILARESENAASKLKDGISSLQLDPERINEMEQDLRDYARNVVVTRAKKEAENVLHRMTVRYKSNLTNAIQGNQRGKGILDDAYDEALKVLAVMAAARLDEKLDEENLGKKKKKLPQASNKFRILFSEKKKKNRFSSRKEKQDEIDNILFSSYPLKGKKKAVSTVLDSNTWPEVSPNDTLITPAECKLIMEKFGAGILEVVMAYDKGQDAFQRVVQAFSVAVSILGVASSAA